MDPPRAGLVLQDLAIQITPGNLPYLVLGAHDYRELFGLMFLSPGPIANKGRKEPCEAVRVVGAGRFKMAAKRFRSHVNAVDRLRVRARHRRGIRWRPPQVSKEAFLVARFERLQPYRSMVGLREGFHPLDQLLEIVRSG